MLLIVYRQHFLYVACGLYATYFEMLLIIFRQHI